MYMVLRPHNKMWIIKIQNSSINSWKGINMEMCHLKYDVEMKTRGLTLYLFIPILRHHVSVVS